MPVYCGAALGAFARRKGNEQSVSMQATDLAETPPRRWSDELGGVRWLPRMLDKARAAKRGALGDYLYGQSPMDRSLLRTLSLSYREFSEIVREAGEDDERVVELIEARRPGALERARAWSERLPRRHRLFLLLIDLDDGYASGPLLAVRPIIKFLAMLVSRYVRYRWPAKGALIGLEIERERAVVRARQDRGAEEEPYRWLTAQSLDFTLKLLLCVVLAVIILNAVLAFVERIGPIFVIIVGAIFFAYLIYPVVRYLNRSLPLIAAILLLYACIISLVAVGLIYLIPAISAEVINLVHAWPSIQRTIAQIIRNPHNRVLSQAPPFVRDELARLPKQVVSWLQQNGSVAAGNAISVLIGTAAFVGATVAIPVLGAYLLYDSETIKRFFVGFIPERARESTLGVLSELEQVIGGYIRGQLMVGATVGTLIALGLLLVHEPYALLIGLAAGVLDLIPYIGPVIAFIPACTIAFAVGGLHEAFLVAVVFVAANQLEGHVIAPNIVSRTIALSPSAVVLAILIGGDLYGVLGMFVAVPVAGIIRVLLLHVIPGSVSREEARPVLSKGVRGDEEEAGVGEAPA